MSRIAGVLTLLVALYVTLYFADPDRNAFKRRNLIDVTNRQGLYGVTTVGVAPEHRRRGIATRLLAHIEDALRAKEVGTIMLEVRVGNIEAQQLYRHLGYFVVQRISRYYNNGEDCFLMMKAII